MKPLFVELIRGNLPKRGKKEEFSVEKKENYFYLYHLGNPSKDQIMSFNYHDANSKIVEENIKKIFRVFGYKLNEQTKKWKR